MKCGKDLTEKKKQDIKDLQIGIIDTLKVFCKAEIQKDKQLQGKHKCYRINSYCEELTIYLFRYMTKRAKDRRDS